MPGAPVPPARPTSFEINSPQLKTFVDKTTAVRKRVKALKKTKGDSIVPYDFDFGFKVLLRKIALKDRIFKTINKAEKILHV